MFVTMKTTNFYGIVLVEIMLQMRDGWLSLTQEQLFELSVIDNVLVASLISNCLGFCFYNCYSFRCIHFGDLRVLVPALILAYFRPGWQAKLIFCEGGTYPLMHKTN